MKFDVPIRFAPVARPVTIHLNIGYGMSCQSINQAIDKVCWQFGVPRIWLLSRYRHARVALARQVLMFILHEVLDMTHSEIGAKLRRHHATSVYAVHEIQQKMDVEPKLRKAVATIRASLR